MPRDDFDYLFDQHHKKTAKDDASLPTAIDWDELWADEVVNEWLVDGFWPLGRQLHLFAPRKAKKSLLTLWIAANLAAGRDPFTGRPQCAEHVIYLDFEMTEEDLLERAEDMGFTPDDLRTHLHYYLLPSMPKLDTDEGGQRLMRLVERDNATVVVIDTLSRVVEGEENSNDTFQNFYTFTGLRLKRDGVSMIRLDHEGHTKGRSRGGSAKADDVDVVWRLSPTDDGLSLERTASRISWVEERVDLTESADPLAFRTGLPSWPAGTAAKAKELDAIGAPLDVTKRGAIALLKAAGKEQGRGEVLMKAIKHRRYAAQNLYQMPP